MSLLNVSHVSRQEDGKLVVNDVSFVQHPLQNIAIAGATGSGKTTLLKMIAGLIEPTAGHVYFKEERIKGPNEKLLPGHPNLAYLSQHFELRNHYRVREILDMAKKLSDAEAALIYDICRIKHFLQRWTHQLSGGEKQRTALARLLVTNPELLLLDEPYSNLDPFHKNILKMVIDDLRTALNITTILVSHDPLDTLAWAHQVLILNNGVLVQQATPQEVYARPADEYVAGLFGKYTVLTPSLAKAFAPYSDIDMGMLGCFIRPEEFRLVEEGKGAKAEIETVNFMGGHKELVLQISGIKVTVVVGNRFPVSNTVYLSL
jgi:ABC-type Fe3+/spermidine/putrescine transport system ATPase subunit